MTSVPRTRIRDRIGADEPVVVARAPVAVGRPDSALDVEDVGTAVNQKVALLATSLLLHHLEHPIESRLDVLTKLGQNRAVYGRLAEFVNPDSGLCLFRLQPLLDERLDVVADVADDQLGGLTLPLGSDLEVVFGLERPDGRQLDRLDELEQNHSDLLHLGPGVLLAEELPERLMPFPTLFPRELLYKVEKKSGEQLAEHVFCHGQHTSLSIFYMLSSIACPSLPSRAWVQAS